MDVPFACVAIMYCRSVYGGVHGGFLVGYCGPGNCISIVKVSGFIMGCWSGLQDGKVMLGESLLVGCVFSEKYSMGHVSFKVIKDGVYVVFAIDN